MPNASLVGETSEALAARAAAGDGPALAALIERVQDSVYRLSLRMLWSPDDAQDASQEVLFKIVTSVATFRGESSFRTWALRVATNHLLNVRRSRVEMQSLTFDAFARDLEDGLTDDGDFPARIADEADQALLEEEVKIGCTQAMLLCLDRDDRIAYILGDVFEIRSEEAGEILAIAPAAYRKRLSRARERLRDFMRAVWSRDRHRSLLLRPARRSGDCHAAGRPRAPAVRGARPTGAETTADPRGRGRHGATARDRGHSPEPSARCRAGLGDGQHQARSGDGAVSGNSLVTL